MEYVKDKAIILSTRDYGEADRLVAFLTQHHGKVIGIAKHARKSKRRFVNSLDIFNLVEIEYGERRLPGLVFIKKAILVESFSGLREDILKLSCAGLIAESIKETVPEREKQPEIFELLAGSLIEMEISKDPINVSCLSLWRLLSLLGLSPRLGTCLICKRKTSTHGMWNFDPHVGGTVCIEHRKKGRAMTILSKGIISLLERTRGTEIERLWRFKFRPDDKISVLQMLVDYIQCHIDRPLKSMYVLFQLGYNVNFRKTCEKVFNNKNSVLSC
ncbi:MAG: DNA repair protein RecO [Deltaproteobacteria bacterium]|nr:MAG: DNA repair protein RecO [Deltaproteobacteria bacterium]